MKQLNFETLAFTNAMCNLKFFVSYHLAILLWLLKILIRILVCIMTLNVNCTCIGPIYVATIVSVKMQSRVGVL